jgi:hypothetical protein
MSFDPVPWAVTGAATAAAEARVLANIASHDSEGVVLSGDFKVTQTGTPSGSVQIGTGGMVIKNFQAPGESYVGKASSSTLQAISPTGGTGRSDLIIARVIDPDFAPWQPYTDPNQILNGPYFQPFVVAGVSPSTTSAGQVVSYSAYALARIDIPAGTTNILTSMITDLRSPYRARTWHDDDNQPTPTVNNLLITDTTWRDWPENSVQVTIPPWATFARCSITLQGLLADNAADFASRINLGGLTGQGANFDYDAPAALTGVQQALNFTSTYRFDVRSLQGTTVTMKHQAQRINTGNTGNIWTANAPLVQAIFRLDYDEECV